MPSLTTLAVLVPINDLALVSRLASLRSSVAATRPPTLTSAPGPNRMPFGLIRKTWPLAFRCPRICVPLVSKMRLTAIALDDGCTKSTVCCGAMLKVAQLSDSVGLSCVMVVTAPDCAMRPLPAITFPPKGSPACTKVAPSNRVAAISARPACLPRPRVFSATGIQT